MVSQEDVLSGATYGASRTNGSRSASRANQPRSSSRASQDQVVRRRDQRAGSDDVRSRGATDEEAALGAATTATRPPASREEWFKVRGRSGGGSAESQDQQSDA